MNSLNEAISVVQDPESCSVTSARSLTERKSRIGASARWRYSSAAASGSISSASSPATPTIGVIAYPTRWSKTWPTFEAGSVETSRTRLPRRARSTAVAQAMLVFPTPPFPVRNKNLGGLCSSSIISDQPYA